MQLLTPAESNAKTAKDTRYTSAILHLAPYTKSGKNLCAMAHKANDGHALDFLDQGGNIAVVFDTIKGEALPPMFWGREVIDGDLSDLRFLDPDKVVVGLRSKGKAKKADGAKFCWQYCLDESGRGTMQTAQKARLRKSHLLAEDRAAFKRLLVKDIEALLRRADRDGKRAACRLNGTSDQMWERIFPDLFVTFSEVQWYDYTKIPNRTIPSNYHLTYSLQFVRSAAMASTGLQEVA